MAAARSAVPHAGEWLAIQSCYHTHLGKLGVYAQVFFVLKPDFFLPSCTPCRRAPRQYCPCYAPPSAAQQRASVLRHRQKQDAAWEGGAPIGQSAAPAHGTRMQREWAVAATATSSHLVGI